MMISSDFKQFKNHIHWNSVLEIVTRLNQGGHTALIAGGAVRDALLGRPFADFDIATSATPEQVESLFPNTRPIGKAFGVILVIQNGVGFEVATFRGEKGYQNGRHPTEVYFTDAKEDALRRDFTINALFFDPLEEKIIDVVNGIQDLESRLVRAVGDANHRFLEDHLRIIRAVRFAAQLGFELESSIYQAVINHRGLLKTISQERIWSELEKMHRIESDLERGWGLLCSTGILDVLFGGDIEMNNLKGELTERFHLNTDERLVLFLLLLIYPTALKRDESPDLLWKKTLNTFKSPQKIIRLGLDQLKSLTVVKDQNMEFIDQALGLSTDAFELFFAFWSQSCIKDKVIIRQFRHSLRELLLQDGERLKWPTPLLDGNELLKLGLKPGPEIKLWLKRAYRHQLLEESDLPSLTRWLKAALERSQA